jgi:hypothetical protein
MLHLICGLSSFFVRDYKFLVRRLRIVNRLFHIKVNANHLQNLQSNFKSKNLTIVYIKRKVMRIGYKNTFSECGFQVFSVNLILRPN